MARFVGKRSPPFLCLSLSLLVTFAFCFLSLSFLPSFLTCIIISSPPPPPPPLSNQISYRPLPFSSVRKMNSIQGSQPKQRRGPLSPSPTLGRFGWMMVNMLGSDLPFTLFVPSEPYFQDLLAHQKAYDETGSLSGVSTIQTAEETAFLRDSANLAEEEDASLSRVSRNETGGGNEDIYAIVSRILGFSAIPEPISAMAVPIGGEIELESISGYKLYLSNDRNRGLVVNNLTWEPSEFKKGHVVVHLVCGVLMDSEFERSVVFDDFTDESTL